MFSYLSGNSFGGGVSVFAGMLAGFFITLIALKIALKYLPSDQGRKFAVNGELSKGKPRGAGSVFVVIFVIVSFLFSPFGELKNMTEYIIVYVLLIAAMLTGYLDDISKIPWGEVKKGLLDLIICIIAVVTYCNFDGNYTLTFPQNTVIELPPVLYMIIAVFFLWVSINVTNCTDGVDGLLGTLSAISMAALALICNIVSTSDREPPASCVIFTAVILAYLIYNASPSQMLMGDAGSRALGLFIGITTLKTHIPLIYFFICGVIFADGGIGLVKLLVIRIFKAKNFLKNIRTPLHDHYRKNKGWSDTQVVTRFTIIHIILCAAGVYIAMLCAV